MSVINFIFLSFLIVSCAASPMIQPQINGLVIAQRYPYALEVLQNNAEAYGPKNKLLYTLDYAMVLHLSKNYKESIDKFEEAKNIFDQLLTKSISNQTATWLINDNSAFYHGEDFERALINVFQALNFVMLGEIDEALVEARDANVILEMINRQYKPEERNVYSDDAFIRLLMGILYEIADSDDNLNDAYISYAKAVDIYENNYRPQYQMAVPEILKENILTLAKFMGEEEFRFYKGRFSDTTFRSLKEKKTMAEVYLIQYHGYSPMKYAVMLPIPLPDGYITKLAFPKYEKRPYNREDKSHFKAVSRQKEKFETKMEIGEDINAIAIRNLENRQARVIAKAVARMGMKYAIEKQIENQIYESNGRNAANVFRYLSGLYNITSEQADLRSWITMPGEIRLGRLLLPEGSYDLFLNDHKINTVSLKAGEKRIIMITNSNLQVESVNF